MIQTQTDALISPHSDFTLQSFQLRCRGFEFHAAETSAASAEQKQVCGLQITKPDICKTVRKLDGSS